MITRVKFRGKRVENIDWKDRVLFNPKQDREGQEITPIYFERSGTHSFAVSGFDEHGESERCHKVGVRDASDGNWNRSLGNVAVGPSGHDVNNQMIFC